MKRQKTNPEKIGIILYYALLIGFIGLLIYTFCYPAIEYTILKDLVSREIGTFYYLIFLIATLLGVYIISKIYYNIVETLFYPLDHEDEEFKIKMEDKKLFHNYIKRKITKKEYKIKEKEIKIKMLNNKIKKIKKQITTITNKILQEEKNG